MNLMKICDLTQSYTETSGGIRTFLHAKREYILNRTNHSHVLIVPGETDRIIKDKKSLTCFVSAPLIRGCEPYRFVWNLGKVRRILKKEKPDIIELGSPYILPFTAFIHRMQNQCGIVGFYHTDFPTAYVKPFISERLGNRTGKFFKALSSRYSRLIYNQCDATVTSSRQLYSRLCEDRIRKVELVPLGVDTDLFSPQKRNPALRHQLGIHKDELLCVYHGRLDNEKRIPMLLESFKRVSERHPVKLLIIGEGPLYEYCRFSTSENRVILMPFETNRERLASLLASADIYCTAGPFETFGLSVLEAQASGLAVCGVRAGALRERVSEHVGILSEPDNIHSFAEKLLELSTNGFRQRGKNARRLVQQNYSWDLSFHHLFGIYEEIHRQNSN